MLKYKKLTAFLAALLIGASAAALPAMRAFADEEPAASASESTEAAEAPDGTDTGLKTSGAFSYSITQDNTACIEDCSSTEKNLVIPAEIDGIAVTELGMRAFGSTPDQPYETIALPASLSYISSSNPFIYCPELKEIALDEGNSSFALKDGVLFTSDMKTLVCYPPKKSGSSYTVPDGVETLGAAAIYSTELEEINLPSTLKEANFYALSTNHALKAIDMSGTQLVDLPQALLADCTSLTDVKFAPGVYKINAGDFWGCTSLTEITIPDTVESIGQNAFMDTGLTSVHIPDSVVNIGYCAFGYHSGPTGGEYADDSFIIIGSTGSAGYVYSQDSDLEYDYKNNFTFMTEDEYAAHKEIADLEKIGVENFTIAKIDDKAYILQCTAEDSVLNVPAELGGLPVAGVYPAAFSGCTSEKIILPEGITSLREMSFYRCPYLTELVLPQSLETIGDNCFDSCNVLETIDCGGAKSIGSEAFNNCVMLRSVTISGNCTDLGNSIPFDTCVSLEEINVTDGDGSFCSKNGVLFSSDGKTLIEYPLNRSGKIYKVPKGTEKIADCAFSSCRTVEDIVLPKSVTSLGDYAFYDCTSLKKLRATKKLKNIGTNAFGFVYNEAYDTDTSVSADIAQEGFKLYAPKNSAAYDYAKELELDTVTGTVRIGNKNISIAGLSVAGALVLMLLAAIGVSVKKHLKPKKAASPRTPSVKKSGDKKEQETADDAPSGGKDKDDEE